MEQVAGWLLHALIAEALLLSLGAVAMVLCRQPGRRVVIARMVLAGSLAMVPLLILDAGSLGRPRWGDLLGLGEWGLLSTLVPEPIRPWMDRIRAGSAVFIWVYVGLCGAVLGWTLLGSWAARRLRSRSEAPGSEVWAVYREIARPFGRVPDLRVSDRVRGPMLLGALRPVIVIPPTLDDSGRLEEARLSLLHELEHSRRGDLRSAVLASVVQACWPVLPMVWWIRAQLLLDQEFLADREASARFGPTAAYASSLVTLASDPAHVGASVVEGGTRTPLMLRVLMLLKSPFSVETRVPGWWRFGVVLVVGFCAWEIAGVVRPGGSGTVRPVPVHTRHGSFRLARLVVEPSQAGPDGLVRPYRVMCPRPETFRLKVDVWASPLELGGIEIAGVRLVPCAEHFSEAFHRVEIEQTGASCHASIDGRAIPVSSTPEATRWIELRAAPGEAGRFRNLVVQW